MMRVELLLMFYLFVGIIIAVGTITDDEIKERYSIFFLVYGFIAILLLWPLGVVLLLKDTVDSRKSQRL